MKSFGFIHLRTNFRYKRIRVSIIGYNYIYDELLRYLNLLNTRKQRQFFLCFRVLFYFSLFNFTIFYRRYTYHRGLLLQSFSLEIEVEIEQSLILRSNQSISRYCFYNGMSYTIFFIRFCDMSANLLNFCNGIGHCYWITYFHEH